MFGQILTIARNTFIESVRQPIFFVLILACGVGQIANTLLSAYSMGFTEDTEVFGDDKMLLDMGLATVMVCATLLAAFVATSVLSREIENRTALTVISKPVGRPLFVLGKYLGVAAAILVASTIMIAFLMFAIRHRVMSMARDSVDGPVVLFATLAVLAPIVLAVWGNYFYNWVFTSTAVMLMLPATVAAYLFTLTISKDWAFQPIGTDFKPQIMLAASCALMSIMVLTAVAVAASTRLGQVMTIVVCAGLFVLGLLSNHLLGRHAFDNQQIGVVLEVSPAVEGGQLPESLDRSGRAVVVRLTTPPRVDLKPGTPVYYGPEPNGIALAVPRQGAFTGDAMRERDVFGVEQGPGLVVRSSTDDIQFEFVNVNNLGVKRLPREGDYLFARPTEVQWPARVLWAVVPNLQSLWLVDAVTQGHPIPGRYVGLAGGYALVQIVGALCIAVMLFQKRDMG